MHIVYHAGRENVSADALSRHPHEPAPQQGIVQDETQVAAVHTEADTAMSELLQQSPVAREKEQEYSYGVEQLKDQRLKEIIWTTSKVMQSQRTLIGLGCLRPKNHRLLCWMVFYTMLILVMAIERE